MYKKVGFFFCANLLMLLMVGCGDSQRDEDKRNVLNVQSPKNTSKNLNEKNFVNIAKYHYIRELAYGNVKRAPISGDSVVMRKLRAMDKKNQKGVFYVKTIKSPQNFIHYMRIKCDGAVVHIESDIDKKRVTVKYTADKKVIVKDFDLASFTDTGVNIKDAENGEKI